MIWFAWIYGAITLALAVYGTNMLLLLLLSARFWRRAPPRLEPDEWPSVVVQLPTFNERYMVERLIDAVAALDYPRERLLIQVLDDSTDDTAAIAQARVASQRARGVPVNYVRRADRAGFKAGALAAGLTGVSAEFVAIFDADFVPPPDFLKRVIPVLLARPRLGMVQTRWEHLNVDENAVTGAVALALDGYFVADQFARCRSGLMGNFNGSAGVWRRAAIDEAGGWNGDTLTEDLDLSYRAQLRGWQFDMLPEVAAPSEVPATIVALKNQQFRWAKGSFQVLRKLAGPLLTGPIPLWRKLGALAHLTYYLIHPLMILGLLCSLPLVLMHGQTPLPGWLLALAGLVGMGPLLVAVAGQVLLRRDWVRRLRYIPAMVLMGIGLSVTSTVAFWEALAGRRSEFVRTPKPPTTGALIPGYMLPLDNRVWAELALALYALVVAVLALDLAPGFVPWMLIYTLGYGYSAALAIRQTNSLRRAAQLHAKE